MTHTDAVIHWLLRRRTSNIIGAVCQSEKHVDRGPGHEPGPCTRPVWMDMLCSACWHERMSFHGRWALFQANPAASLLSGQKIQAMTDIFGTLEGIDPEPFDWEWPGR